MENRTWSKERLDRKLYEKIRERMFTEFENACSFSDFFHVDEFLRDTDKQSTDAENETMGLAFKKYTEYQFWYDLSDMNGEALDDMANFMSKMMSEYGSIPRMSTRVSWRRLQSGTNRRTIETMRNTAIGKINAASKGPMRNQFRACSIA